MEVPSSLEYLCRVCAANTKGKNSVAECVYIFKNTDLKQKIEKHLLLKVCENDALPKVLCKACYRKVEDIAALTNIAKHTHEVFNDYLINNSAKGLTSDAGHKQHDHHISNKNIEKLHVNSYKLPSTVPPPMVYLPGISLSSVTKAPPPLLAESKNNNALGNTHLLSRENLQRNNHFHRKQNLMLDTKYAPKSIAQKSLNLTITQQKKDANHSNKKHNPPGVINFFPTITKQPLVNTLAGGNYLMSRLSSVAEKDAYRKLKSPSQPKDLNCPANTSNSKRKNASRSTINDKGANHVVSLLKICSQKQKISVPYTTEKNSFVAENPSDKLVTTTTPTLICSSPENNKLPDSGPPANTEFPEEILLGRVIKDVDLLKLILKALKWTVNKDINLESQLERLRNSKFTDIMSDPNLLQDTDLTQLLGPYLAPVLQAAYAFQQQQQLLNILQGQNSAQITIESKPIQLTTNDINRTIPYKLPPETSVQLVPALPEETSNPKSSIPTFSFTKSKSANSNISNPNSTQSIKATITKSKPSHTYTNGELYEMDQLLTKANQNVDYTQQFKTKLKHSRNSIAIPSGEALMAFARKQKNSTQRRLNKRGNTKVISLITAPTNPCETSISIDDDDDIVLVEHTDDNKTGSNKFNERNVKNTSTGSLNTDCFENTPELVVCLNDTATTVTSTGTSTLTATAISAPTTSLTSAADTAVTCTRPIAKRRKTVIHTAIRDKSIICENTFHHFGQQIQQTQEVTNSADEMKRAQGPTAEVTLSTRLSEQSSANGEPTDKNLITTDQIAKTGSMALSAETEITETSSAKPRKQSNSRMALGQHLMEAIGIQKVTAKSESVRHTEVLLSKLVDKGSVQQIRSVLKRSLKQAQEHQHRKLEFASTSVDNENHTEIESCESKEMPSANNNIEDNQGENTISSTKEDDDLCKSSIIRAPRKPLSSSTDRAGNDENEVDKMCDMESREENTSEGLVVGETNTCSLSAAAETTTQHQLPGRRRGRKRNADKIAEAVNANNKNKYEKVDQSNLDESLRRPIRQSKTMSKYYKGPGKSDFNLRSLPLRTTRNKKNS